MQSSRDNDKQETGQSQASSPQPHPRDGYIIIQRRILDEGFSAYELGFLVTCLLIAGHKKSKTPGVVNASTTELGQLMGASQKTAWKCKQVLIARGIIKPLASHGFIIVNYEDYQSLALTSLVPQTKNATKKGPNFSPTDLPLVPQTKALVSQTNDKSHRLTVSPTDYSLGTNQIAELNKEISNSIKEVRGVETTPPIKTRAKSKPHQVEAGIFLDLVEEREDTKIINRGKAIRAVRAIFSKYPETTPEELYRCFAWLRDNDSFLHNKEPPAIISFMPDKFPAWLAGKLQGIGGERYGYQPGKGVRPKPQQERRRPITYIKGSGEDPGEQG